MSLATMRFWKSVWTCLPLCLILPPANDLHQGVLSIKLPLLCVTSWHWKAFFFAVWKRNVSLHCFTSLALLKPFAKRCPGRTNTHFHTSHLSACTHTHVHAYIMLHIAHNTVSSAKASNVCFALPVVCQIPQLGPRSSRLQCHLSHSERTEHLMDHLFYPQQSTKYGHKDSCSQTLKVKYSESEGSLEVS